MRPGEYSAPLIRESPTAEYVREQIGKLMPSTCQTATVQPDGTSVSKVQTYLSVPPELLIDAGMLTVYGCELPPPKKPNAVIAWARRTVRHLSGYRLRMMHRENWPGYRFDELDD
jgi:hypothetical protein